MLLTTLTQWSPHILGVHGPRDSCVPSGVQSILQVVTERLFCASTLLGSEAIVVNKTDNTPALKEWAVQRRALLHGIPSTVRETVP